MSVRPEMMAAASVSTQPAADESETMQHWLPPSPISKSSPTSNAAPSQLSALHMAYVPPAKQPSKQYKPQSMLSDAAKLIGRQVAASKTDALQQWPPLSSPATSPSTLSAMSSLSTSSTSARSEQAQPSQPCPPSSVINKSVVDQSASQAHRSLAAMEQEQDAESKVAVTTPGMKARLLTALADGGLGDGDLEAPICLCCPITLVSQPSQIWPLWCFMH